MLRQVSHGPKPLKRGSRPGRRMVKKATAPMPAATAAPSRTALTVDEVAFLTSRFNAEKWDRTAEADAAAEDAARRQRAKPQQAKPQQAKRA